MNNPSRKLSQKFNGLLTTISIHSGLNLNKPSYVCAKMTMLCNSRCAHCNIWKTDYQERELNTAQWLAALSSLRNWLGRFNIVFTGGEALLREDMVTILEHAAKIGIYVELLTNGLDLDNARAEKIVAAGISQVTLSFDGINPDTHDRFRGEIGYFERTKAAITSLSQFRTQMSRPLRILLKTVISSNNLGELRSMATWAQQHDLDIRFQPIEQNYGETANQDWYLNSPYWVKDLSLLREQIAGLKNIKASGANIDNSLEELETFVRYFESPEDLMSSIQGHDIRTPQGLCRHALTNFVISSNGDVRMCFKMEPIGNICEQAPDKIWARRSRCWTTECGLR